MSDQPTDPAAAPKHRVRTALVGVGAYVAVTALATQLLSGPLRTTIVPALVIAALLVGGFVLFRVLARALGWLTAIAAMSLIGATVMGAYAAIAPTCPDAIAPGRCSTSEIGTWVMVGAMMPAGYILALGVPIVAAVVLFSGARAATTSLRDRVRDARAARSGDSA